MTVPEKIGRYTVTGEVGHGAMGVVYRGIDPALDRPVAIKVIATRPSSAPLSAAEAEARFLREARMAARISHPNVVTVYDAGREMDSLYLVMELIEGETLGERLARKNFPSPEQSLLIAAQVAEALNAAHALGVVHRDIKPGNIMLTKEGRVKVADFGVAKGIGEDTNLTRTGTVVGSPAYMAPEQVRGERLDGRADLFSLGVVLYELLLRRKPFPADTVTTLIYQILHDDPLANPQISRELGEPVAAFLRRCLAKQLEARTPDGATFAAQARVVAEKLKGVPPLARDVTATAPTARIPLPREVPPTPPPLEPPAILAILRRLPVEAIITGIGVVLLLLAVVIAVRRATHHGPARVTPAAALQAPGSNLPAQPVAGLALAARPPAPRVEEPTPPPIAAVFRCRRAASFSVSPGEALITINSRVIGRAEDWNGRDDRLFEFPRAGTYYAKLSLAGYQTTWVEIVVDQAEEEEIANVDTTLPER